MKIQNITFAFLTLATVAAISTVGCKKTSASAETTNYQIFMTDAPGEYQEVNVNIVGAEVHSNEAGWVALTVKAGVYNLLKLSNGIDSLIASGQVAVGTVSEIRLILGTTNNSVKIENVIYPLATPSADQSGLKLKVHSELIKGITYSLMLDFDAGKSIVKTGSNTYKLKPVVRVITTPLSGAISGTALPIISQPAVIAINGSDTFGTYANALSGAFLLQGLAAGSYKVMVLPKFPFRDTAFSNITVNVGAITAMGTLTIK